MKQEQDQKKNAILALMEVLMNLREARFVSSAVEVLPTVLIDLHVIALELSKHGNKRQIHVSARRDTMTLPPRQKLKLLQPILTASRISNQFATSDSSLILKMNVKMKTIVKTKISTSVLEEKKLSIMKI